MFLANLDASIRCGCHEIAEAQLKNAIILAGGKGERLRPFTEDRPKCMVPVLGNPLLSFQLNWLRAHGITNVVVCCGYLHEVIQKHFGNGQQHGVNIEYLIEKEPLGRGGALKGGMKHFGKVDGPVLAFNGDSMTNLDITAFTAFHKAQGGLATLVSMPLVSPYGIVEFANNDNTVSGFTEKPTLPFWINAGIYILDSSVTSLLPDKGDHEETCFPQLAKNGQLKAYKANCFWKTVDTVKDLSELRSHIESFVLGAFFQPVA
jgi:NDP-sugar pyrophosphorylase family protein